MLLDDLAVPIVLAPLAGGPSTPALTAAVSEHGGFGFLAAGYLTADDLRQRIDAVRQSTRAPFGVNVFLLGDAPTPDRDVVNRYAERIQPDAEALGATLGSPRHDDDDWAAKLELLRTDPVPAVSFTFGCPDGEVVDALHTAGSEVWVTVTSAAEASAAVAVGADVVVAQGAEAGGHRGSFSDDMEEDLFDGFGVLALVELVTAAVDVPVVGAGAIATGAGVAAVIAAGARAAQLGTAFLCCPEAGTADALRSAVQSSARTAMTRAFTGRLARGIDNAFLRAHSADAPAAYPEVHNLTAPMRRLGRETGRPEVVNLWAGQAHELTRTMPAADLLRALHAEAIDAVRAAATRVGGDPTG